MELRDITVFKGTYAFLSNFYPCEVPFQGLYYPSAEHAYQASKSSDPQYRRAILITRGAGAAKRAGKTAKIDRDWDKLACMNAIVRAKFISPELSRALVETFPAELVEGNWWNDTFWGVCQGVGENHLGRILMAVRNELRTL